MTIYYYTTHLNPVKGGCSLTRIYGVSKLVIAGSLRPYFQQLGIGGEPSPAYPNSYDWLTSKNGRINPLVN
jgi:hypothetical protein